MVSEERAKLMAKAEIMREKEWDRALKLGRFYRRDYISYKMIRSAFSFVFAYLLVFVMWALYHAEEFMTQKQITELADMGIHLSMGTDCPVEDMNPIDNLYCAVTRTNLKGLPEGGFHPEEMRRIKALPAKRPTMNSPSPPMDSSSDAVLGVRNPSSVM